MALCNVSLQVIPSVSEERIYPVVDKVIEYIASTGVKYKLEQWKPQWREN